MGNSAFNMSGAPPHGSLHQNGGSDEIDITGLTGSVTNGDSHDHSGGDGAPIICTTVAIHQVGHGLSINNPVKLTTGSYSKAQADAAANSATVGIVSAVAGADDFTLLTEGRYTSTAHGLTVDNIYYLSAASAGALTATEPSTAGNVSKPLVYVIDANTLYFHNWRGMVVGSAPGIHHTTHESGGSDEIDLTGLTGIPVLSPTLITNSGFGVCSNCSVAECGPEFTVTAITAGVCTTTNTQGLAVGSVVKFDAGGSTGGKIYVITAVVVNTSFTIHDTSITDATDVTGHEVTAGFVAADTKCFDKWTKTSGVQVWRWYDPTQTYITGVYGAKVTGDGSAGTIQWSDGSQAALPSWYLKFAGRDVVIGCWCYASSAPKARLGIVQSSGTTWSDYHTGAAGKEWLEVTAAIASDTTTFSIVLDAGISNTAYFSQPMLNYGDVLGEGNYVPQQGEMIWFEMKKDGDILDGGGFSDGTGSLYLQPDSLLTIPCTARAAFLNVAVRDSGSAGESCFVAFDPISTAFSSSYVIFSSAGVTNDVYVYSNNVIMIQKDAIIYYYLSASGSGTLDLGTIWMGVIV